MVDIENPPAGNDGNDADAATALNSMKEGQDEQKKRSILSAATSPPVQATNQECIQASATTGSSASCPASRNSPTLRTYYYADNEGNKLGPYNCWTQVQQQPGYFLTTALITKPGEHPDVLKDFISGKTDPVLHGTSNSNISTPNTKRRIVKRPVGSASTSVVQVKDAVVRTQFEMLAKKIDVVHKMTAYKSDKQESNNPKFTSVLITMDEIVPRPDEHLEGERNREKPLVTIYKPHHMRNEDLGAALEYLGKKMQEPKSSKKKRGANRPFDYKVATTAAQLHELHYGPKKKKAQKVAPSSASPAASDDDGDDGIL